MGTHALLLWEVSWWSRSHSACSTRSFRASQPGLDLRRKRGYWIPNLRGETESISLSCPSYSFHLPGANALEENGGGWALEQESEPANVPPVIQLQD